MSNVNEQTDWQDGELQVVVNDEEQYSIWPADRDVPAGWRATGFRGMKAECLRNIEDVCTDMRPLSYRRRLETESRRSEPASHDGDSAGDSDEGVVDHLVKGRHPLELVFRPEPSAEALRSACDNGFVLVKFTDTKGGTELGIRIDRERSDLAAAYADAGSGRIRLDGTTNLDDCDIRCIAEIDLPELRGTAVVSLASRSL